MYQEEHVFAGAKTAGRVSEHSRTDTSGRFNALIHAHEAVRPMGGEDPAASRRMVESLREAALKSFESFIDDPMLTAEDEPTRHEFDLLAEHLGCWKNGEEALSELIDHMNQTLATGALQAHVGLCERFISVHNIFSLLQLKQIQMQATQSLAATMSHTARR